MIEEISLEPKNYEEPLLGSKYLDRFIVNYILVSPILGNRNKS